MESFRTGSRTGKQEERRRAYRPNRDSRGGYLHEQDHLCDKESPDTCAPFPLLRVEIPSRELWLSGVRAIGV